MTLPYGHRSHRRRRPAILSSFGVAALGATLVLAGLPISQGSGTRVDGTGASDLEPAMERLREGTGIVDQLGYFKTTGDRATFYTINGGKRLGGLPNLNLERIVRVTRDNPGQLVWSVSGSVTEYQGSNYLLITRAVLKANRSPPSIGRTESGEQSAVRP